MSTSMWDKRYSEKGFAYGTRPNDFLKSNVHRLPARGRLLCLAEGEGRNAVFLASQGFEVVAVDSSKVGLKKAEELARLNNTSITTVVADLGEYPIEPTDFDGIISIFCHLPQKVRSLLHNQIITGLKHGGILLLEGYTPKQLELDTGGPPRLELMMDKKGIEDDFAPLSILHCQELVRPINEGRLHTGPGAVVQFIGMKT